MALLAHSGWRVLGEAQCPGLAWANCRRLFPIWKLEIYPGATSIELPHSEQIAAREAMETRMRPGDVGCELWNDTIAPLGRFQLAANNLSNSPVEIDQDGVDRLKRLLARRLDELDNLGEYRLLATCQVQTWTGIHFGLPFHWLSVSGEAAVGAFARVDRAFAIQ